MAMAVLDAASDSIGVDTIEDAERVEDLLRKKETTAVLLSSPSKKNGLT
jgi:hypothetical protein